MTNEPKSSPDEIATVDAAETNDIQAIQAECSTMISLLQDLEKEEHDLQCQLEILAKEALLCGFQNDIIEPPIPRKRAKKQANDVAKENPKAEKWEGQSFSSGIFIWKEVQYILRASKAEDHS